jgi:transposase
MIRCHQNASAFFGGWPRRILYDNMRQVVIRPDRVNPRFHDFARYQDFEVKRHPPLPAPHQGQGRAHGRLRPR